MRPPDRRRAFLPPFDLTELEGRKIDRRMPPELLAPTHARPMPDPLPPPPVEPEEPLPEPPPEVAAMPLADELPQPPVESGEGLVTPPPPRPVVPRKFDDRAVEAVLDYVRENGWNVAASARAGGVSPGTVRNRMTADPAFRAAMEDAREEFLGSLERAARDRARDGYTEVKVGPGPTDRIEWTKVSDPLMILLLKKNDPKGYGDRVRHEHEHRVVHEVGLARLPADVRRDLLALLERAGVAEELADLPALMEPPPKDAEFTVSAPDEVSTPDEPPPPQAAPQV